jgi:hypothetical protein
MTARLTHHRPAQMIEACAKILAPLLHRSASRTRPTLDDDACRFAFGV